MKESGCMICNVRLGDKIMSAFSSIAIVVVEERDTG
jgi:hypothetical protein